MISLRSKALLGFLALVVFGLLAYAMIQDQHLKLQKAVDNLESLYAIEEALTKVNTSVAHAILHINDAYFSRSEVLPTETIQLDTEAIQSGLHNLIDPFPSMGAAVTRLTRDIDALRALPVRSVLIDLRTSVHVLVAELDQISRQLRETKTIYRTEYLSAYDSLNQIATSMGGTAILVFSVGIAAFFTRLSNDLTKVKGRALDIVKGYRGAPLFTDRADEVGELTDAINDLQKGLRERELQLELSRQQHFHREKMATVGVLASAIAHEINNPIAAIQAIAERIDARDHARQQIATVSGEASPSEPSSVCADRDFVSTGARMIIEQTSRIATITRQLSEFSSPQAAEARLVDLNEVVRNSCRFIAYEPRMRKIALVQHLDADLPATRAVADHLTQVLMNMLINAADAVIDSEREDGCIEVSTSAVGGYVLVSVRDNGIGMSVDIAQRAFDEFYTTKSAGKGTGIGLFVCLMIARAHGGTIDVDPGPGRGACFTLRLPTERPGGLPLPTGASSVRNLL